MPLVFIKRIRPKTFNSTPYYIHSIMMLKKLHFILQSKGGVGKSFLVWLLAHREAQNEAVLFIDLDHSTQTTHTRLARVVGEDRVTHYSLLDEHKKIEREEFLNMLQAFSQAEGFDTLYLDFGAPESEEFLKFLQYELSADILGEAAGMLGLSLTFNVVLAGNDTVSACVKYARTLTGLLRGEFQVNWFLNLGLSGGIDARRATESVLRQSMASMASMAETGGNVRLIGFGDLGFSQSAKDIVGMLADGSSPDTLPFASKLKFRQVLKEFQQAVFQDE